MSELIQHYSNKLNQDNCVRRDKRFIHFNPTYDIWKDSVKNGTEHELAFWGAFANADPSLAYGFALKLLNAKLISRTDASIRGLDGITNVITEPNNPGMARV
jgi:hypothetical protein